MNRHLVPTILTLGIVSGALAGQPTAAQRLLEQLCTARQTAAIDPSRLTARKPQLDLKQLLGVSRYELVQILGSPDFCALPEDATCMKSTRLAYFYYPQERPAAKDTGNGLTEITVTAGGGSALELFLADDSVNKASWVKQD